ncbi:iron ABC transporter ATP-binding protein [Synergistales bacterium]|nr:iron ABC transporter ATP-binding protein [Synergistales bacterium]
MNEEKEKTGEKSATFCADKVGFRYGLRGEWLLRGFSCSLPKGEIMAVLGPNGCGKTTLLKLLLGILKPVEGSIRRGGHLGYVPQVSASAFDHRVLDMVVMGRAASVGFFSIPEAEDYRRAENALARLGIRDLAERGYARLSGGQRQLVLIARALVSKPCGLVLDEPTSALDFKNQDLILSALRQLADEGLSVVMTTHAPHHALHVASRVLVMENGARHFCGPPEEIVTTEQLRRLYDLELKTLRFEHRGRFLNSVVPIFS